MIAVYSHNPYLQTRIVTPALEVGKCIKEAFAGLTKGMHYSDIYGFDDNSKSLIKLTDETVLYPGKAYFIQCLSDVLWRIPQSVAQPVKPTTFAYDAEGNRVKKIDSSGTTIYAGEHYEVNSTGGVKHIFMGNTRVCSITVSPNSQLQTLNYYHPDHLGSTSLITNEAGNVTERSEYQPYGEFSQLPTPNSRLQAYYYTGKELDSSTGLYYYGARYYNSELGRFITPDPIEHLAIQKGRNSGNDMQGGEDNDELAVDYYNPQNLNKYAYCRNNPLKFVDPNGLYTLIIHGVNFPFSKRQEQGYSDSVGRNLSMMGETVKEVCWSGSMADSGAFNYVKSEILSASQIAHDRGEKLNIIGHSWGGVLAASALRSTGVEVDNFVTLGTPYFNFMRPKGVIRYVNFIGVGDVISFPSVLNLTAAQRFTLNAFLLPPPLYNISQLFAQHNYWNNSKVFDTISNMFGLNKGNK